MLNDVYNSIQSLCEPIRQNICCFENVLFKKMGIWNLLDYLVEFRQQSPKEA